jgi:RNA recognition motif-containing protein
MANDTEAKAAIEALHGKKVKGHRLRVKEATGEKAPTPPKFSHAKTAAKKAAANLIDESDE